nr:DMT family transporter [Paracoccus saliphilus]
MTAPHPVAPPLHSKPDAPQPLLGMVLGLVGVVIFGATLPITKLALADFSPAFVTTGRAVLAGLAALALLVVLKRSVPWPVLPSIALAALMLVFGFPGLMAVAMQTVPAAHGGVILGVLPLATAGFAALLAGERPSAAFWGWSATGAALVAAFALREAGLLVAAGDFWLLASGLCAALGYVIFGKLARRMPGWEVISWALVITLPLSLIGALLSWESGFAAATPRSIGALLYAAFFSMFLGFFAWNTGLAVGGIARVSQVQLLQSFVTLAVAATLLGESISLSTFFFAAAVAGVVWMGRRSRIG